MVAVSAKGAVGTPFVLDVEAGKVREFAKAVRADGIGAHVEGDHPVVPPTFLTVQMHWETFTPGANPWDKVEMSFERGMHAEQEYVFHGPPPRAGERLYASSRIDDIWTKASKSAGELTFVRMITEFRDADGNLRAEAILTGVETGHAPTSEGA